MFYVKLVAMLAVDRRNVRENMKRKQLKKRL